MGGREREAKQKEVKWGGGERKEREEGDKATFNVPHTAHVLFAPFLLLLQDPGLVVRVGMPHVITTPPLASFLAPLAAVLAPLARVWQLFLLRLGDSLSI